MPVMVGSRVFIIDGAFKGMEGVVRSVDGGQLTVAVEIFGRVTPVPLREDQVQTAELDPRDGWRAQLAADSALGLRWELNAWWIARLGEPENDRVGEWAAFEPFQEQARQATAARLAALLADFDATFTDAAFQAQGHSGLTALWTAQAARWNALPAAAVADLAARRQVIRELSELRYSPDPEDNARYEREKDAVRRRDDEATARRERAAYAHRRHLAGPAGRSAPARVVVDEDEEPLRRLVRRTHGLVLPDHVFTFGAFWRGLTPEQSEAMCRCGGIRPAGVLDLLDRLAAGEPAPATVDGLDPRLEYRYYRDPPEFLTLLCGDTDGLHFGLWYDDPDKPPQGVASYYNNDGGGIGWEGSTLLEAVRNQLEWHEFHTGDPSGDIAVVRDAIMQHETGDRPETGEAYHQRYHPYREPDPSRVATVDELGVWVPPSVQSPPRRDTDAVHWAIVDDAAEVQDWVAAALQATVDGRPADALALGHDLHWMSSGQPEREEAAARLLEAAYRQLDRGALADIAAVHHQHRDLKSVSVYVR
jgi:hypothetical protein